MAASARSRGEIMATPPAWPVTAAHARLATRERGPAGAPPTLADRSGYRAGVMFWFRRKRLPGSYSAFSFESRS